MALAQTEERVGALQTQIETQLAAKDELQELLARVQRHRASVVQRRQLLLRRRAALQASSVSLGRLRACLDERRLIIDHLAADLDRDRLECDQKVRDFIAVREQLVRANAQLALRRKEVTGQVGQIFHVQKFSSSSKGRCSCSPLYRVVGIHLPDAERYIKHTQLEVSTALGYVAQLVLLMSRIFDLSLCYSIRLMGSKSAIVDLCSRGGLTAKGSRVGRNVFPLFSRHQDKLMFEYGVFLLNTNIAHLRRHFGLSTTDLRCTLANLSSLLTHVTDLQVATAESSSLFVYAPLSPGGSLCSWSTGSSRPIWCNGEEDSAYSLTNSSSRRSSSLPSLSPGLKPLRTSQLTVDQADN